MLSAGSLILFCAHHDNPPRRSLGRNTPGCGSVIHQKLMVPRITEKGLPVCRGYHCVRTDIQLQGVIAADKIFIKILQRDKFPGRFLGNYQCPVLGWIN